MYNGNELDIVSSYTYLGVPLNYNAKYNVTQRELYNKANRAMFGLIAKCRQLKLPIDVQIKLFDSVVKPVMTYGSEIWGFKDIGLADKLQLRFLKIILGLKINTPTLMVRGESGCLPISCDIRCTILNFWFNIVNNDNDKILNTMYKCMYKMSIADGYDSEWLTFVKDSLNSFGLGYIYDTQAANVNHNWFKNIVKSRVEDAYRQSWHSSVQESEECVNYRLFKEELIFENYLINLPWIHANNLLKFRTRNCQIPVVKYRFDVLHDDSKCYFCNKNYADEYHYVMECPQFNTDRNKFNIRRPNALLFGSIIKRCSLHLKFAKVISTIVYVTNNKSRLT